MYLLPEIGGCLFKHGLAAEEHNLFPFPKHIVVYIKGMPAGPAEFRTPSFQSAAVPALKT